MQDILLFIMDAFHYSVGTATPLRDSAVYPTAFYAS